LIEKDGQAKEEKRVRSKKYVVRRKKREDEKMRRGEKKENYTGLVAK
jgi:hypothetical protein